MREDKLGDLSMELSVEVLQLTKELRGKHESIISNQIGRSATSICANIAESKYAHSCVDFIAKLEISLKEANETIVLGDIQSGNLISGFNRIEVAIDENNVASIRLFEKMGFDFVSKEDELLNYVYEVKKE